VQQPSATAAVQDFKVLQLSPRKKVFRKLVFSGDDEKEHQWHNPCSLAHGLNYSY
jgi:hypothetical protein